MALGSHVEVCCQWHSSRMEADPCRACKDRGRSLTALQTIGSAFKVYITVIILEEAHEIGCTLQRGLHRYTVTRHTCETYHPENGGNTPEGGANATAAVLLPLNRCCSLCQGFAINMPIDRNRSMPTLRCTCAEANQVLLYGYLQIGAPCLLHHPRTETRLYHFV